MRNQISKRQFQIVEEESICSTQESIIKDITKDKNLRVLMDPEVTDLKNEIGSDLEYVLKYQLLPEITMPNFKNITVEKPILEDPI